MAEIPSYLAPNAPEVAPATQDTATDANTPHVDMGDGGAAQTLYDVRNKTTIEVPHDSAEIAIRSGLYAPEKNKEYFVKDTSGQIHGTLGKNLKQLFEDNHTLATPEEAHAHTINEKYGNSELLAGLEGVNRGAFPYVADKTIEGTKDGNGNIITKEDLAGRAEANPISSTIGELGGTLMSPLTKVLGLGGKAVEAGAANILSKVATKAGLTNKVAQAILSKVVPAAAGSAVEGAYFGAAHLLNEDALGTAQFNAENLMASVEQGAMWGAALGGGLSATGMAAKGVASTVAESNAGKYLGEKASAAIDSATNSTKAAQEFLGLNTATVNKISEKSPAFMTDTLDWVKSALSRNPSANISEVGGMLKTDLEATGKRIGDVYGKVDAAAAESGAAYAPKVADVKRSIAEELEEKLIPKFKDVEGAEGKINQIYKTIDSASAKAINESGNYTIKGLHDTLVNISDNINFDKALVGTNVEQEVLQIQRKIVKKYLNEAVERAESLNPALKGVTEEMKAANLRYSTLRSLEDSVTGRIASTAEKSFLSGSDKLTLGYSLLNGNMVTAAGLVGKKFLESDMLRKMQILGKIEKYQQATTSAISSAFKSVANPVAKNMGVVESLAAKSLVDSHLSSSLADGKLKKAKDEQQAFQNIEANAKFAADNPEQFLKGVNRYSSHLMSVAPQTSGALDTAALNAMVYLNSKATKSNKQTGFFDSAKPQKASGADMLKMQQRVDMIQHPTKAIKLLGKGKLGATHMETIKAVYPEMHQKMQEHAMNFLSSKAAANLSYGQKLNMATLLGVQADESTHFSNVLGLQANFDTKGDSEKGIVNSTQGGLSKLNKAKRMSGDEDEEA